MFEIFLPSAQDRCRDSFRKVGDAVFYSRIIGVPGRGVPEVLEIFMCRFVGTMTGICGWASSGFSLDDARPDP